jgi:hypothetical protein
MANTYTLIASNTVGGAGAASITFSSIPATYTDLLIMSSARSNRAGAVDDDINIKLNGATTNFTYVYLRGSGSAVASSSGSTGYIATMTCANATANTFGNTEIYIPNYASANYKSILSDSVTENNATESYAFFFADLWSNTAAITSVGFVSGTSNNFVQYSTFFLYGINNS